MKYTDRQKHLTSAFLILLIVQALCSSCGEAGGKENADSTAAGDISDTEAPIETEEILTGREAVKDSLPDNLDLGGRTVRVLTRSDDYETKTEFIAEQETGDIIQDAVYQRNLRVSERLNVVMEAVEAGPGSSRREGAIVNNLVRTSVLAGGDDYDLIGNHMSQITTSVLEGYYLDLTGLDYLDFSQPWWNQSYTDNVTLSGKQFMCAGDLALSMISGTYVTFFNKNLWNSLDLDDNPYQVVMDGEWTIDRMAEYCTNVYSDINGNSEQDMEDRYGVTYCNDGVQADALVGGAALKFVSLDRTDGTYSWILENERTADFLGKVKNLFYVGNRCLSYTYENYDPSINKLKDDTALFLIHYLSVTEKLRDMKSDYGILPMPKLDESQENYATLPQNGFSVFAIPLTCKIPDTVAPFLEAMCAESYRLVTPAYYEVALKVKYARDSEASAMLDLAVSSIYLDFGYIYNAYLGNPTSIFRSILNTSTAVDKGMSTIARDTEKINSKLRSISETYAKTES